MRLAVMQPYLFPYLGYFQLLAAVDRFVVYDDVQYIKNGWINRNRILLQGQAFYWTVPLRGASPNLLIHEVMVDPNRQRWAGKLLKQLGQAYAKAPGRDLVLEMCERVLAVPSQNIASLAVESIRAVSELLELGTQLLPTSMVYDNTHLGRVERLIDMCQREGAHTYINAAGGRALYSSSDFAPKGIRLEFLDAVLPEYPQPGTAAFVPGLSILDLLAQCSVAQVRQMVQLGEVA